MGQNSIESHYHYTKHSTVVASGDNVTIATSLSISVEAGKHYRLHWSGWIDNGGNTTNNIFYVRFNADATAGNYQALRYSRGDAVVSEWSSNTEIGFARTVSSRDGWFSFVLDIFTGDQSLTNPMKAHVLLEHGNWRDNAGDMVDWAGSGVYLGASTPTSLQFGIKTTGTGYAAYSTYSLVQLP